MSLPIITFSLSPRRLSVLPFIAASVRTLVVSWKDAAERNDSVLRDALVIPRRTTEPLGRVSHSSPASILLIILSVSTLNSDLSTILPCIISVLPLSSTYIFLVI